MVVVVLPLLLVLLRLWLAGHGAGVRKGPLYLEECLNGSVF